MKRVKHKSAKQMKKTEVEEQDARKQVMTMMKRVMARGCTRTKGGDKMRRMVRMGGCDSEWMMRRQFLEYLVSMVIEIQRRRGSFDRYAHIEKEMTNVPERPCPHGHHEDP